MELQVVPVGNMQNMWAAAEGSIGMALKVAAVVLECVPYGQPVAAVLKCIVNAANQASTANSGCCQAIKAGACCGIGNCALVREVLLSASFQVTSNQRNCEVLLILIKACGEALQGDGVLERLKKNSRLEHLIKALKVSLL
jgi:hypothetical protein